MNEEQAVDDVGVVAPEAPSSRTDAAKEQQIREKLKTGEYITRPNPNKRARSPVWKRFHFILNAGNEEYIGYVICTVEPCGHLYKYSVAIGTKNLLDHKCQKRSYNEAFVTLEDQVAAKRRILDATVEFCMKDKRPYFAVEGKGFQDLVQACIDVGDQYGRLRATDILPHRTTVSNHVHEAAETLRASLFPEIKEAMERKLCAATVDGCTEYNSKVHFITMTVQYLTVVEGKWTLKSKVLFVTPFEHALKYTHVDIKNHIVKECAKRGFPEELLEQVPFTTDNGSDIVAAIALLGAQRRHCFDHFLNVCLTNAGEIKVYKLNLYTPEANALLDGILEVTKVLRKSRLGPQFLKVMPKGFKRGPFPSKIPLMKLFYEHYEEIKTITKSDLLNIPKAKILNLCNLLEPLEKILATCKTAIPVSKFPMILKAIEYKEYFCEFERDLVTLFRKEFQSISLLQLIHDCKALVTHFKHSTQLMAKLSKTLKQPCETRWNSLSETLDSIVEQHDEITQILTEAKQTEWVKKLDRKDELKCLAKLLHFFKEETLIVEGDKAPTLQYALPSFHTLLEQCIEDESDTPGMACFRAKLRSELLEKKPLQTEHLIATLLCPPFRQLRMLGDDEIRELHQDVKTRLNAIDSSTIAVIEPAADTTGPEAEASTVRRYNQWLEQPLGVSLYSSELERYLREPVGACTDILQWWQSREASFPKLATLARQILCIPASSAASERIFSLLKLLLSDQRTNLNIHSLDDLIFVQFNSKT